MLICRKCSQYIENKNPHYVCNGCGNTFTVVKDILDSRPFSDENEDKTVIYAIENYGKYPSSFIFSNTIGDYKRKLRGLNVSTQILQMWEAKRAIAEQVGSEALDVIRLVSDCTGNKINYGSVVDMGSGQGAMLPVLSRTFKKVYAVELVMSSQLIARKLVEEMHLENVSLIAGVAEDRHFAPESIDVIIMNNLIEHVADINKVLSEAKRCLKKNGLIFFDSGNRYNLFFHEPHSLLWGVGFLPRKFMDTYVRMRTGLPYDDVHLLSLFELKKYLRRHFGSDFSIVITPLHPSKIKGTVKKTFELVRTIPVINEIAQLIVPSLYVVAKR